MLRSLNDLLRVVDELYGEDSPPKPFRILKALPKLRGGAKPSDLARTVRTTSKRLDAVARSSDPIAEILGIPLDGVTDESRSNSRSLLGQLLVGALAERAFEKLYRERMGGHEIHLADERAGRTETDYLVLNGAGRPVFRVNIKFHASRFAKARELVGLEPDDCFALATYKIHQALVKQDRERLNYMFAVVGVPGLTGLRVGAIIPEDLVQVAALVRSGKRAVEEKIVEHLLGEDAGAEVSSTVAGFRHQIEDAEWRVLSATKAARLVRERMFERVYAVRVRSFARNYRNAEVDMHFSLREDLTPLAGLLTVLRDRGPPGVSTYLSRGEF
jgi:hypothetical protein